MKNIVYKIPPGGTKLLAAHSLIMGSVIYSMLRFYMHYKSQYCKECSPRSDCLWSYRIPSSPSLNDFLLGGWGQVSKYYLNNINCSSVFHIDFQ